MTMTVTENNFEGNLSALEADTRLVDRMMKIPHYQKMGLDGLHLIISKARSLNIDPFYAANGALYNVKGKIGMGAEAMAAMIRERGHSIIKDKTSNESKCILHGKRADNGDTWTCSFSIDEAKRAGIYGQSWEKYPGAMTYARAMSFLARQLFPDVIKGAGYTKDELEEMTKHTPEPRIETVDFQEVKELPITINMQQAEELSSLIKLCSTEYQTKIKTTLLGMKPSIDCVEKLPLDLYEKLKKAANDKAVENQQSLTNQEAIPNE